MLLIDVHSHLHAPDFDGDRDAVLARARGRGVARVLVVGEDLDDNRRALEISSRHPELSPLMGLHPDRFEDLRLEDVLEQIRRHAEHLVGIGEVGLDYWRAQHEEGRRAQREALVKLAGLARELDLPLNVHSRSAGHHALRLLEDAGAARVHMHAFDGRAAFAVEAAARGVFFSLPPSVLRSPQKQKLALRLPLEQVLLESDAPVLGPEPGARNEPGNLELTLHYLSEARGIDASELCGLLRANTERAYPALRGLLATEAPAAARDRSDP